MEDDIICGPDIPLKIDKDKELGRGGHALVLRGEILHTNTVGLYVPRTISMSYIYTVYMYIGPTAKAGGNKNNHR